MFSGKDMTWETPQDFYDKLNSEFHFSLDVCASPHNAKCKKFFTSEDNGLIQSWKKHSCWMNPPFGRDIKLWLEKAWKESQQAGTTVLCLTPARTDTIYQHQIVFPHAKAICFIKGRLKYSNSKDSAPFPNQLVLFGDKITDAQIKVLTQLGYLIIQ